MFQGRSQQSSRLNRQAVKNKPGTLFVFFVDPDPPTMSQDDRFTQVQPQASAFGGFGILIGAIKAVKHKGDVLGVKPFAFVADTNHDFFIQFLPTDGDLATSAVFQRIGDQIGEQLFEALLISNDDGKFSLISILI